MSGLLQSLKNWWESADRTQKTVTIFGAAMLVLLIAGTFFLSSRPKMVQAFSNLSAEEQAPIYDELTKLGIPVETDRSGAILLPEKEIPRARMALAKAGKLPKARSAATASAGGPFSTPSAERALLKKEVEHELVSSIEALEPIQSARVHITYGTESAFANEKQPPTASVIVTEKPGMILSRADALSIARVVEGAIQGLDSRNISIVSSDARTIWDGKGDGAGGAATRKLEAETAEAKRRQQELQQVLDTAFGHGHTLAIVQVELDMDEVSSTRQATTATDKPATEESVVENLNGPGGAVGGVVGAAANTGAAALQPAAPATTGNGKDQFASQQQSKVYPLSTSTTETKRATGAMTKLNVNVLANKSAFAQPGEVPKDGEAAKPTVAALTAFVQQYVAGRGDAQSFSASVTPTDFDATRDTDAEKTAAANAMQEKIQLALSALPIATLLLVGLLLARSVGKAVKAAQPVPSLEPALAYAGAGGALALGSTPEATDAEPATTEPRAMSQFSGHPFDLESDLGRALIMLEDSTPEEIQAIRERIDVPLEQIKALAGKKPEAVAMLLKSWLLEDRR